MSNTQDEYLLLSEVAKLTKTPLGSVRHWCRIGTLPSLRPGRRRLVRKSDLDAFLARASKNTPEAPTR